MDALHAPGQFTVWGLAHFSPDPRVSLRSHFERGSSLDREKCACPLAVRERLPMRLVSVADGFVLPVKVVPGASRQRVVGKYAAGIKVTVTAAAQGGAANEAVIALLADTLRTTPANLRIISGHGSPRKQVLISGVPADAIERRLLPGE